MKLQHFGPVNLEAGLAAPKPTRRKWAKAGGKVRAVPGETMRTRAYLALALVASLIPVAGCGSSTPVVDPSTVVTPTTTTEVLSGSLACCLTSDFKTVTVAQAGNIDFALTALSVNGTPSTILMNLGIGTVSGASCVLLSGGAITGAAGAPGTVGIAELSGQIGPGAYCLQVTDVGNVPPTATVNYTITVSHT
jgi:hypothetical protein